jgi:hypothetical protein
MKPFHPLADIFPLMEGDDFEALVGDMKRRGFRPQFPIIIFEDQNLDGRNRARAAEKAGIEPVYTEFRGTTQEAERFVIQANIHRRHLTASQKRDLLKKLLKKNPEQSDRSLGKITRLDGKTVAIERRRMEATAEIPQLEKTVGKDGKSRKRPAKPNSEIIAWPCEDDVPCTECNDTNQIRTYAADIEAAREQYLAAAKSLTKEEKMNQILILLRAFGLVLYRDLADYLKLTLAAEAS